MSTKDWRHLLLAALLGVCLAASAIDGRQGPVPAPTAAQGEQPAQPPVPTTELQNKLRTKVSVDFRETPIEDVVKSFVQRADIDIVKGPMVTGKVTATLTDVPLDEAMDSILAVHG